MDKHKPGEIYWAAIEPYSDKVSIYDGPEVFLGQLSTLPEGIRHLFSTHWCQSEVCNGGFHQFFWNSTGILAPEAATGFAALGLNECGNIVRETMAFFGIPYPRDRETRISRLEQVPGQTRAEWDPFYLTDDRFYKALKANQKSYEMVADGFAKTIAG